MTIAELYLMEVEYWKTKNQGLFGITPINEFNTIEKIQEGLNKDCNTYWNTDKPCKLAEKLNTEQFDRNILDRIPNSYQLKINPLNMCVDVYATYNQKVLKVCVIPTPSEDLTWIINNIHYVPRVTAVREYNSLVGRKDNLILGEGWSYDLDNKTFKALYKDLTPTVDNIFNNHLSIRSETLLSTLVPELTVDNFEYALSKVPEFDGPSIFNYKFMRFEYFEDIILNSNRYAMPIKKNFIAINSLFLAQGLHDSVKSEGQLLISESPIFALENFRTVINVYHSKGNYTPNFSFSDTIGFFDSFKTATSHQAGRQRLLLDNIVVRDGMLFVREDDGSEHSMYEYINNPPKKRLSCLSEAPFGNNDKSKRIMMNAKIASQAVPLKDEICPISHRILARVGFMDLLGYSFADAIIISESFAKRLTTYDKTIIMVEKPPKHDILTLNDLETLFPDKPTYILSNYRNMRITHREVIGKHTRLTIEWEIPFGLGDKLSNLHGAKGVVGKILPDNEMPKLVNKVNNMEPGPLEVIISGFSTIRRGSLGQIFEAWALTNNIETGYINTISKTHYDNLKQFSKDSIVEFRGERINAPLGICNMVRLYHHASIHISESSVKTDFNRMIKLGEMEKLSLIASNCTDILRELSVRSLQKYSGSRRLIRDMEMDRELPKNLHRTSRFATLLKSIGYDLTFNGNSIIEDDLSVVEDSSFNEWG